MQTLNEIITDLNKIAADKNYSGATVDAIIYLTASAIYKNQMNVIATSQEISPSSCTLVNSAIQHALDKNYSVYRGKNQHIIIKYAKSLETKSVKKYDVCTKVGKYKLVYARDYDFETGTRFNGDIELILCEDLIEETFNTRNKTKKYIRSTETDLTEDLDLYENGRIVEYANNIDISLAKSNYINQTCNSPYLILTDTDYGIICWCYDRLNSEIKFLENYSYSIKSPKYTTDTIDPSIIKSIPGFDIKETIANVGDLGKGDGIVTLQNLVREEDVNNIFIESSTAEHSGNIIRSINDIKNIFLNYFAISNIRSCKTYFSDDRTKINIIYLLDDKNKNISEVDMKAFKDYLQKAYYVTQEINIQKATGWKNWADSMYKYEPVVNTEKCTVTFNYDSNIKSKPEIIEVTKGETIKLPHRFTWKNSQGKSFLGWKIHTNSINSQDTYALSAKNANNLANYIVDGNVEFDMVFDRTETIEIETRNTNITLTSTPLNTDSINSEVADTTDKVSNGSSYQLSENNENDEENVTESEETDNNVVITTSETSVEKHYIDIYYEKDGDFYQRVILIGTKTCSDYTPAPPNKEGYKIEGYVNELNMAIDLNDYQFTSDTPVALYAVYSNLTFNVQIHFITEDIIQQNNLSAETVEETSSKIINYGETLNDIQTPAVMTEIGMKLSGLYIKETDKDGNITKKKFDLGTQIKESLELYAEYANDYDLDIEVYFDSPLNNTELHNFIENYSYEIGETFEPMKIVTQMSKEFKGISWINLNSSKQTTSINRDSYYDFTYNISFNNNI